MNDWHAKVKASAVLKTAFHVCNVRGKTSISFERKVAPKV